MTEARTETDQIGPYKLLRPLAKGGMAEVYEVMDVATGEHLALKLLMQTGGAEPRFHREYEAMIRLNHPNIVRVYAYGMWESHHWMAMELIEGTAIQAAAKEWGKPGSDNRFREVVRAARDLALALDHIHGRGLVHRDLKSANVLVLPDGRVKLIDFGTARVSDPVEDITKDGEFIGTFAYASPEQLKNEPIDGRSDLYSLGVLLYRLSTGRRPFETDDIGELARLHVRVEPPTPTSWVPELDRELDALIMRLLAKDPARRYQTGLEVAEALERLTTERLDDSAALRIQKDRDVLIGRESQQQSLYDFLARAADPNGYTPGDMVLIVGPHGAGRHQLVQHLDQNLPDDVTWTAITLFFRKGAGDEIEQVIHTANQLVRALGTEPRTAVLDAAEAVRRVERSPYLSAAERLVSLKDALARLLQARSQLDRKPVVVFVRGIQHSGSTGVEVVAALREAVRALSAQVVFVADLADTADLAGSPTRRRFPEVQRVPLPAMNTRQVALLVGALLHRRPPPVAIARRIHEASGGLPTYVEAVTNRLLAEGLIDARPNDENRIDWAQHADFDVPVPEDAREQLIEEMAALPADRRRCLEVLALCGREGSVTLLAKALEWHPAELATALKDLDSRGWITLERRESEPYARLKPVLAEGVVLGQLHPCRRRLLERRVVDVVANEPPFVAQIDLLVRATRYDEAFVHGRDWALYHLSKHRPISALEVLDRLVPLFEQHEADARLEAEMNLLHATALLAARPSDPRLPRALERAGRLFGEDILEAEVRFIRAQHYQLIGHYPRLREELSESWRTLEHAAPSALGASVATMLGWSAQLDGKLDQAAQWYGRARRIAKDAEAPLARIAADLGVAGWELARGHVEQAARTAAAAIPVLVAEEDLRGLSLGVPIYVEALCQQGRFSDALRVLEPQIAAMRECEVPTFYVRVLLAAADTEMMLGRLGRAQEHVDELWANLRRTEHLELRLRADLAWGRIQVASGLYGNAAGKLALVEERARAASLSVIAETALGARAEALWMLGSHREALEAFQAAVAALQSTGDVPALAQACLAQARAMCESVDPDKVLGPVAEFVEEQSVVARIDREIARGRNQWARGRPSRSFDEAQRLIEELIPGLTATDVAALRLHPWTRHVRRARKGSPRRVSTLGSDPGR